MTLRNLRTKGADPSGFSPVELVALARAQIGLDWSRLGAGDFVWSVANLTGARYGASAPAREAIGTSRIDDLAGRVLPDADNFQTRGLFQPGGESAFVTRSYSGTNAFLRALRPGDIVHLHEGPEAAGVHHSFIVTSVQGNRILIVDNWSRSGPGGTIREHALGDVLDSKMFGGNFDSAYVSRLTLTTPLQGTPKADLMQGDHGNNLIQGYFGNDRIYGRSGNDTIIGGAGFDQLNGGGGNDVILGGDQGDRIMGGSGNDSLHGGAGPDRIWGNAGADSFYFRDYSYSGFRLHDTIVDFNPAEDSIRLHRGIFAGLAEGNRVDPDDVVFGPRALDPADRLIYDRGSGALMYDPDGNGPRGAQYIAEFSNRPVLTLADFDLYG